MLSKILKISLVLLKSKKGFLAWAFAQLVLIYGIEMLITRPKNLLHIKFSWLIVFAVIFAPICYRFWLDIKQAYENATLVQSEPQEKRLSFSGVARMSGVAITVSLLIFVIKLNLAVWIVTAFFSSLLLVYALVLMLNISLLSMGTRKAMQFAGDFWIMRSSIPAFLATCLMLAHSVGFILGRSALKQRLFEVGFSVSSESVTIWTLSAVLIAVLVWLLALLNTVLVVGFLEIVNTKKAKNRQLSSAEMLTMTEN